MKGNKKLIESLNMILTGELTAINQYFIHSMMCANWGLQRLAAENRKESVGEMKHAESLIERILFLEGVPNVQRMHKVRVGETVPEQMELDLKVELDAIPLLNKSIAQARDAGDNATRELLESILKSEEEHVDWLEAQIELIKTVGLENYLAQQMHAE